MSMCRHGRNLLYILFIGLSWSAHGGAVAQERAPVRYHLKIASQPLDEALQEFARQSGVQIIFFSRLTAGLRAPALDGRYTVAEAMGQLLADSQLTFRVINSRTIEIRSAGPERGSLERFSGLRGEKLRRHASRIDSCF